MNSPKRASLRRKMGADDDVFPTKRILYLFLAGVVFLCLLISTKTSEEKMSLAQRYSVRTKGSDGEYEASEEEEMLELEENEESFDEEGDEEDNLEYEKNFCEGLKGIEYCNGMGFYNHGCVWIDDTCVHQSDVSTEKYEAARMNNPWYRSDAERSIDDEKEAERDFEKVLANLNLDNIECIPVACDKKVHFFETNDWTLPDNFSDKNNSRVVYLPSLPGSGNTWTRSVIREGTRVWTGSVYLDKKISQKGYSGESLKTPSFQVSAVKTHWPAFGTHGLGLRNYGRPSPLGAIHVVRSPIDAQVSEFKRLSGGGHTGSVGVKKFQNKFAQHLRKRGHRTEDMLRRWTAGDLARVRTGTMPLITTRQLGKSTPNSKTEVLTIYYEDLVRDFVTSTAKMFWFLKRFHGANVPSVRDSVICAIRGMSMQERFHRKSTKKKFNPFLDMKTGPQLVKQWCEAWSTFWNVKKWGECTGAFQDFSDKRALPKLPDNMCPYA